MTFSSIASARCVNSWLVGMYLRMSETRIQSMQETRGGRSGFATRDQKMPNNRHFLAVVSSLLGSRYLAGGGLASAFHRAEASHPIVTSSALCRP